uniref:Uncharacterized protein n=1 Tax=Amphora coffeiformis TaxID=265554 RepID=A0A7S3LFM2_9STRA|mmetsp:Transcript_12077/g.23093  ORF Transcript_12077/g.23093 Transcript_12077/m.23093 type:complete len:397 (-) Transcript_12077:150-1340(-)|eukprot:scaffold3069_cov215-Amphora_coffeaeformis.AAC.10
MAGRDNLDQKFVDDAEASLMAALGISDTKKGAKEQGLVDSDGNPNKMKNDHKTMDQNSDQDLAGLAEILPEVSVRKPEGGERPIEDENEAHIHEDGVDSVTPHAELDDNAKSKQIMNLGQSSMHVNESRDMGDTMHSTNAPSRNVSEELGNVFQAGDNADYDEYPDSENALEDDYKEDPGAVSKEFINSAQSISTATRQTHDVKMPMYLPNFKPATGCTNASDFIVRCFVARLRSGITVVKHGRSRWCKSRLRVLQIHPDGRSLSWKPAEGEPSSSKKPPRLDLTTCLEVRHAWSPDPQNPMYTGTPILRQKCEAANAHKSFALIFKNRTVDITAVTADQCKVLMEGFSALCFRLQVANIAGGRGENRQARPMPEEDGVSTTASATLTNTSTPRNR